MDEQDAWLRLIRIPGLHGGSLAPWLDRFGGASRLLEAGAEAWQAAGIAPALRQRLGAARSASVDADRQWLLESGRHFVTFRDARFPALLAQVADPPLALFVQGRPDVLGTPQLAIVGARNPTPVGRDNARAFARQLAGYGLTITSGLATGIDAAAHRGALDVGGITVAVCACGLDRIYPPPHRELAAEIAAQGALVSEFPPGTPPLRHHFPHRNRIISGLALGTLVVEAAIRSGSLITARLAAEQGREVFAIPGSIHNPLARGCHRLIRDGARLVETAPEMLTELGPLALASIPAPLNQPIDGAALSSVRLDKDHEILLDALGFEPAGVDHLVGRTGFEAGDVASMLLILELEGRIESCPGGLYIRTRSEAEQ